jgi:hypothetical protein
VEGVTAGYSKELAMASHCCICESRIVDFTDQDGVPTSPEVGPIVLIVDGGMYEFCASCADSNDVMTDKDGNALTPRSVFLSAREKRKQIA